MALPEPIHRMTVPDFLGWESSQPTRHEFIGGEIFAMAGAEDRHVTVCGNIYIALRQALSGSPCRTYMADMKLAVDAASSVFYPDLLVTYSAADEKNRTVKREPTLLVEVLSPSTAAYDLGAKFGHYRRIASLQEYLVIDIDDRRANLFRKGSDGLWVLHPGEPEETVHLASLDVRIEAGALWADVVEVVVGAAAVDPAGGATA